ncbi:8-oxoguanine DNA glycosylase OGG fold protein [Micromonospora chersina]|uniref:8-oxoguanine DNA glycosylase OGG fold protein n=1 Tax=Micromonospora chersina TaxID=47854 RepID=UPI0037210522
MPASTYGEGNCPGIPLPHDTSSFDRGVVEGGLRPAERDWLIRQRRAWMTDSGCRSDDPDDLVDAHAVPIVASRWARFGELPFGAGASPLSVRRRDVTEVARQCRKNECWLPLLVASVAWGWGKGGFGPTRLGWILDGNTRWEAPPRAVMERRLAGAVETLDREGAVASYRYLLGDGQIPGLGPAFFTKFLYFADRAAGGRGCALILDARLARQMGRFWQCRADEPYAADGRSPDWLWQGPVWSAYRYHVYLSFVGRIAAELSESGERWTPELVELLLFRGGLVGPG